MPRLKRLSLDVKVEGMEAVVRELERRKLDVRAGVEAICHAGAAVVREELAERGPGRVGESVMQETTRATGPRVEVSVGPDKKRSSLGRWLEFGTRPHRIPRVKAGRRKAKVLKIGERYARFVNHPGARARPFMRPGLAASRDEAMAAMGDATRRVVRA